MAAFGTEIKEKIEKQKSTQNIKHIPKDAQVIMSILKELNITDYEPRVINQLLEFTYSKSHFIETMYHLFVYLIGIHLLGYVTCILDDAKVYANHGKKKAIDLDDVKLASQMLLDRAFTTPPPRDVLFELARSKNVTPLPFIKPHCGLRLPPDRYCLTSCNYKLRAASQLKKVFLFVFLYIYLFHYIFFFSR